MCIHVCHVTARQWRRENNLRNCLLPSQSGDETQALRLGDKHFSCELTWLPFKHDDGDDGGGSGDDDDDDVHTHPS